MHAVKPGLLLETNLGLGAYSVLKEEDRLGRGGQERSGRETINQINMRGKTEVEI